MRREKRHVALTMDNFSGHEVDYVPRNVEVHFFEPNITPYVQPCDAGIIYCLKAHYRTLLYRRAIELDEAGETDIYSIDLLSAIRLLNQAWKKVSAETIRNCWRHTGICPDDSDWEDMEIDASSDLAHDRDDVDMNEVTLQEAWRVMMAYATSDWTRADAENELKTVLQGEYNPVDWQGALDAVMESEDTESAIETVDSLRPEFSKFVSSKSHMTHATCSHLRKAEEEFLECVKELAERKCINGKVPSINELLDPPEEREDADSEDTDHWADGDKGIKEIASYIRTRWDATGQIQIEDESDEGDEDQDSEDYKLDYSKALSAAKLLEEVCSNRGDLDDTCELSRCLRRFRGELIREREAGKQQVTLDTFFG